jgi:hypothetical protein
VSNVLKEESKQQVLALGRLGWSLRRIQKETGIRRETISAYLKDAGVQLRLPRARLLPAKPASCPDGVTTDSDRGNNTENDIGGDTDPAKPASAAGQVISDSANVGDDTTPKPVPQPERNPSSSACEAYREVIDLGLSQGRNSKATWQDLVDIHHSLPAIRASGGSSSRFVASIHPKHAPSSRRCPVRKVRSITAPVP